MVLSGSIMQFARNKCGDKWICLNGMHMHTEPAGAHYWSHTFCCKNKLKWNCILTLKSLRFINLDVYTEHGVTSPSLLSPAQIYKSAMYCDVGYHQLSLYLVIQLLHTHTLQMYPRAENMTVFFHSLTWQLYKRHRSTIVTLCFYYTTVSSFHSATAIHIRYNYTIWPSNLCTTSYIIHTCTCTLYQYWNRKLHYTDCYIYGRAMHSQPFLKNCTSA